MTEQSAQMNSHSKVAQALAVSARQLAEMLDVSLRQVWRLNAAGKLPRPIRLGGSVRWNREEIQRWFETGCPDRKTWEARKAVQA
jgi:predicted DNA-binding transcriptional regulator AlpA